MSKKRGKVFLVGAGPGDAGLLTLRGAELLKTAEVVIHDALVNPDLLKFVPAEAEIIYAGKKPNEHVVPQDEINNILIAKATEGKRVVRLKGGDPYTFGRGGEEVGELAKKGIAFEVVPGVSSISAVPNYAGIPITHRDYCSSFTVLTGHHTPEGESSIDWDRLAKSPGTIVVLMGVQWIRKIAEELIKHGKNAKTPVAAIRNGTMTQQQTLIATLGTLADRVDETAFKAPAVFVIGEVVRLREQLNWFEKRPLIGQRVVVTRTQLQAGSLSEKLRDLGAQVLEIPTIKIVEPTDKEALRDAFVGLNSYEWLVFTSPNGVEQFFNYFFRAFEDLRDIGGVRIAAVGPATAAKLKSMHLKVDLMPPKYSGEEVAKAFKKYQDIENVMILLMRAEVANPELPAALEGLGAIVDDVACYKTVPETEGNELIISDLETNGADWITFTSASTVENFHARFDLPELISDFPETKLLSIGSETTKALRALGIDSIYESEESTIESMVGGILEQSL